ncbi:BTB/POZ and MATH domain-containing protein 2 [Triticum urartu]|uniref:BTB/POZ and MATH domain-containing protein 2 n=2 Tax=Triticum urartu TaxID=4572 RepID=M7ZHX6_TRIUA|nr:BTB/POZ and MATH domain-containing protein 2 [Triticum urartu]
MGDRIAAPRVCLVSVTEWNGTGRFRSQTPFLRLDCQRNQNHSIPGNGIFAVYAVPSGPDSSVVPPSPMVGWSDGREEYISVYLELMSKYVEALAFVDLRLINQVTGDACTICAENRVPNQFRSSSFEEASWGREKFISKRALKDSGYIRDNRLVIECVITVIHELRVSENKESYEIEVPPPNALEHFGKMLKDKSRADVTFEVRGEMFPAHRAVLSARSPVFKAQLSEPMKENKMRHITVDRMEPVVFEALLHFVYTDSLPTMDDLDRSERNAVIQHLFVAADQYGLDRLKLMCERILCLNLDVNNVDVVLRLADRYDCQKLKEACVDFLVPSERIDAVVASRIRVNKVGFSLSISRLVGEEYSSPPNVPFRTCVSFGGEASSVSRCVISTSVNKTTCIGDRNSTSRVLCLSRP